MSGGVDGRCDPLEAAGSLVAQRFPDAVAAWLGGSVARGEAGPTSDLDVTVLLPGPPAPFRESLRHGGWPVELFVHTRTSLEGYLDGDRGRRRPTLHRLVGESVVLLDTDGSGERLRASCAAGVLAGPPPLSADELASARYTVTDLLDDLVGARDAAEMLSVAATLWEPAGSLLLTGAGRWTGAGKGLLRELRAYDAQEGTSYADRLLAGLGAAAAGDADPLARVCQDVLDRHGGRLFEGHRLGGTDPGVHDHHGVHDHPRGA